MSSRQSNSGIFSKVRPPLPTKDVYLPSITISRPLENRSVKGSVRQMSSQDDPPQEMYQNPLYQGHFHDENLGHEHIPGEFDQAEAPLEEESEKPEVEEKKETIRASENIEEDNLDYLDPRMSQLSEGGVNRQAEESSKLKKFPQSPGKDQGRMSKRIFDSRLTKNIDIAPLPETQSVHPSVRPGNKTVGGLIEKYDLPGNTHFEKVIINTQQISESNLRESVRLSSLINQAAIQGPKNNNKEVPMLSMVMSPQQQEIYYKMYYLKANTSVGIRELAMVTRRDGKWFAFLEERAGKMKERLRDESKILNYMIESVIRVRKHYDSSQDILLDQKKKLYQMASVIMTRKVFEEKLRFEMDYLRHKIEESRDIEKEADLLLAIFSTLSDDTSQIRNSIITEIEHKDIHSLALKKYDEFHDFVNKLDIALQDYRKYYRLDSESDEFKRKVQALLAVLTECDDYSRRTFQEIKALNLRVSRELRFLIEKLKSSNFDYQLFFTNLEDSCNLVARLIYLRREKLPSILEKFNEIDQDFQGFSMEKTDSMKIFSILESKLRNIRKELKSIKKLAKNIRDDPKSQLFINMRLQQTQKLLYELRKSTNRCNAYLHLVNYLNDDLGNIQNKVHNLLNTDKEANESHEKKNRILSDILNHTELLERRLSMSDLKPIAPIFRAFINKLKDKYEKIGKVRPPSEKDKRKEEALKFLLDQHSIFKSERDRFHHELNGKLDNFSDEKNLGIRIFENKVRSLLRTAEEKKASEKIDDEELDAIIKEYQEIDHYYELLYESLFDLTSLKSQVANLSFQRTDFSLFSEGLQNLSAKLTEITEYSKHLASKPLNWDLFLAECHEFFKIFKVKLSPLQKKDEEDLGAAFEKGLLSFLSTKNLKLNKYLQDFIKEWDSKYKTLSKKKSLGSRTLTDQNIEDKRNVLKSLKFWFDPKHLFDFVMFRDYVKAQNSSKKPTKLNEEISSLEEKIRTFYETTSDIMESIKLHDIQEIASALKEIFPAESNDFEIMMNVYRKALELRDTLKTERETLDEQLMITDREFRDNLVRFNVDIREVYDMNKKEIQMIIDAMMSKPLLNRVQKDMKDFFQKTEATYYESKSFSLRNITDFVDYSYHVLQNRGIFSSQLADMREALIEFKNINKDLSSDWELLQPNFTQIRNFLSAFCAKEIKELLKYEKKQRDILFFSSCEKLDEIRSFVKANNIEKWLEIWNEIHDVVAARRENQFDNAEQVKELEKKLNTPEFKKMDETGVLEAFIDLLKN